MGTREEKASRELSDRWKKGREGIGFLVQGKAAEGVGLEAGMLVTELSFRNAKFEKEGKLGASHL
jgi:hypothetical protein